MIYKFDPSKNKKLIELRSVSFEQVITILEGDGPLTVIDHPNVNNYSHQKMYVIEINDYAFLVPFVENGNEIFLKTIFPSRKATKKYLDTIIEV